jgi:hypothetical protein
MSRARDLFAARLSFFVLFRLKAEATGGRYGTRPALSVAAPAPGVRAAR